MMQEQPPADGQPPMAAPEAPAMEPEQSTVNRPASEPVPSLPPNPMPSTTETEMHAMPSTPPPVEEPAALPETTTPPTAIESTTPPADANNDLFGAPATEAKPLPVETPATPPQSDELFGAPAAETPSTDTAPAKPAAEPATPPSDNDLFGPPAEEKPAEGATPPADEKKDENKPEEKKDDLFGKSQAILEMPGGLASHELRRWADNTGMYSVRGRLIRVLDGKVQLLKDTGRTTTVSMSRLSQADFQFVNRQASAQKSEAISKTAQVTTGWSN